MERPPDTPFFYEQERDNRMSVEALNREGTYKLRYRVPPDEPQTWEAAFTLNGQIEKDGDHRVVPIKLFLRRGELPKELDVRFDGSDLLVRRNLGAFPELPELIEIGYIVGGVDPWDDGMERINEVAVPAPPPISEKEHSHV